MLEENPAERIHSEEIKENLDLIRTDLLIHSKKFSLYNFKGSRSKCYTPAKNVAHPPIHIKKRNI